MSHPHDADLAIAALRRAVPYLRLFQGTTFVIKAGGEAFAADRDGARPGARRLVEQVGILHQLGIRVVLVHGGGPQATALGRRLGLEPTFVEGRRVTDAPTLEATVLALNGEVNTAILGVCRELGLPAIGVSGVDAGLLHATRRPPKRLADGSEVDYGHVGDLTDVDAGPLVKLLAAGFVPVVSPLAADGAGNLLNVNADTVAARLAIALGASKLLLATGAPGILRDANVPGSVVSFLDLDGLRALVASGAINEGMLPKSAAIETAILGGVPRVHVVSHRQTDSILREVFTNEGAGTLIVPTTASLAVEEAAVVADDLP
jgi:acetylglutamate kinase